MFLNPQFSNAMQNLQQEAGFKDSAKLLEMWASIQLLAVLGPGGDGLSQRTDIPFKSAPVREIVLWKLLWEWAQLCTKGMCCVHDLSDSCDTV